MAGPFAPVIIMLTQIDSQLPSFGGDIAGISALGGLDSLPLVGGILPGGKGATVLSVDLPALSGGSGQFLSLFFNPLPLGIEALGSLSFLGSVSGQDIIIMGLDLLDTLPL